MSAPHPTISPRLGCSPAESLPALLRRRTRAAHVSTEKARDLEAGLADTDGYAALLRRLRAFYPPAEAALHQVSGWAELDPPLDLRARGQAVDASTDSFEQFGQWIAGGST